MAAAAKRKQVKNACVNCQKACKKCDDARPCLRCVKYGLESTCRNSPRKERKKGVKRGPYKRRQGRTDYDTSSVEKSTLGTNAELDHAHSDLVTPGTSPIGPSYFSGYDTSTYHQEGVSGSPTPEEDLTTEGTDTFKLHVLSELCTAVLDQDQPESAPPTLQRRWPKKETPWWATAAQLSPELVAKLYPHTTSHTPRPSSPLIGSPAALESSGYGNSPFYPFSTSPPVVPSISMVRSSAPGLARPLGVSSSSRIGRRRSHTISGAHPLPRLASLDILSPNYPDRTRYIPTYTIDGHGSLYAKPMALRSTRSAASLRTTPYTVKSSTASWHPFRINREESNDQSEDRIELPHLSALSSSMESGGGQGRGSPTVTACLPSIQEVLQANEPVPKRPRSLSVTDHSLTFAATHLDGHPKSLARASDPSLRSTLAKEPLRKPSYPSLAPAPPTTQPRSPSPSGTPSLPWSSASHVSVSRSSVAGSKPLGPIMGTFPLSTNTTDPQGNLALPPYGTGYDARSTNESNQAGTSYIGSEVRRKGSDGASLPSPLPTPNKSTFTSETMSYSSTHPIPPDHQPLRLPPLSSIAQLSPSYRNVTRFKEGTDAPQDVFLDPTPSKRTASLTVCTAAPFTESGTYPLSNGRPISPQTTPLPHLFNKYRSPPMADTHAAKMEEPLLPSWPTALFRRCTNQHGSKLNGHLSWPTSPSNLHNHFETKPGGLRRVSHSQDSLNQHWQHPSVTSGRNRSITQSDSWPATPPSRVVSPMW
ncbi:hypothetical protein IWQ61_000332 [Dispira simplex]|nr:hypothetical protein IWQ61_000332 [Dispira simplex]